MISYRSLLYIATEMYDKRLRFTIDMVLSVELIFVTIGIHLVAVTSSTYKGKDLYAQESS